MRIQYSTMWCRVCSTTQVVWEQFYTWTSCFDAPMKGTLLLTQWMYVIACSTASKQYTFNSALTKKAGLNKSCFMYTPAINESDKVIQNCKAYETSCRDITPLKDLGIKNLGSKLTSSEWQLSAESPLDAGVLWSDVTLALAPPLTLLRSCLQLLLSYFCLTLRAFCRLSSATHYYMSQQTMNASVWRRNSSNVRWHDQVHRTFKLFLWRGIIMAITPRHAWHQLGWQHFTYCEMGWALWQAEDQAM